MFSLKSSFRLTIRNVNEAILLIVAKMYSGFRLTIRNVNKGLSSERLEEMISFRLTIRNVNLQYWDKVYRRNIVLD